MIEDCRESGVGEIVNRKSAVVNARVDYFPPRPSVTLLSTPQKAHF